MNQHDITPEQAAKMRANLAPAMGYQSKLQERMDKTGFLPSDPLYQQVAAAFDSMHVLCNTLHYASCTSGVGESRGG